MDTLVAKFIINKNLCFSVVEDASFLAILEKAFPGQHYAGSSKRHCTLEPGTHIGKHQTTRRGALYERGISVDSVVGLVRDDASNMRAFCRQAGIDSFQCVAHLLHLVVTGAFTADKAILEIIKNVRAVVSFLHRSHPAQVLLNEVLSSMNMRVRKIPMDVVIRWNSTFAMLDIFHEQRQALYEFNRRWTREKTKPECAN
uniref:Transposase n=1 Tax=Ditylenchus dipsaci TaxID=166011 RepID=A0A915CTX0_9BILA